MSELSVAEIAYAAGVLDGEGCILICQYKQEKQIVLRVCMGNSNLEMLTWFKERFGGSICKVKQRVNLQCYSWAISSRLADRCIRTCFPYLIAKRSEAEVAMRFYLDGHHFDGRRREIATQEKDRRQELRLELRSLRLNRRLERGSKIVAPLVTH